jgi:hypothetical protein
VGGGGGRATVNVVGNVAAMTVNVARNVSATSVNVMRANVVKTCITITVQLAMKG